MKPFDQAWALLKAPIYETPISNINFLTGNREDYDNNEEIFGGIYPEDKRRDQIQQMTPNEYLSRTPKTSHPNLGGWFEEKIKQIANLAVEKRKLDKISLFPKGLSIIEYKYINPITAIRIVIKNFI